MNEVERATGRTGVAAARQALEVRFPILWVRERGVYTAGGNDYVRWSDAAEWVLAQTEGES